jgi:diketogulonate reductase-like aldo/keto reductase
MSRRGKFETLLNGESGLVLLKWSLMQGNIVVTTSSKKERLERIVQVQDDSKVRRLTEEEVILIDEQDIGYRKFWAKFY